MATLTGPEIARRVASGELRIQPFDPAQLNPNSYNLRLADKLLVYRRPHWLRRLLMHALGSPWHIDMAEYAPVNTVTIPPEGLVLQPGVLYLGSTVEATYSPTLVPRLDGRSSCGRLGLYTHITAGYGDVGFCGSWTVELAVVHPLRVYPGVVCCQVSFETIEGDTVQYAGKYARAAGPRPSMLWREFTGPPGKRRLLVPNASDCAPAATDEGARGT